MKIWFDILTPKQLLFFERMIYGLRKNSSVICTTRNYPQVTQLAKIRKFDVVSIGKYGGSEKFDKLYSSINRMKLLANFIKKTSPDLTISFCSPEAARISYGVGIKHIAFSDSPHSEAVMKLSLPFVNKLLIPWIIPKKEFSKYGIEAKNIIHYKAIDAAIIAKLKSTENTKKLDKEKKRKIILVRVDEEEASYSSKKKPAVSIIKEIIKNFHDEEIIILGRYASQVRYLAQTFGNKIRILDRVVDGKKLLMNTDIFLGSGGTMTAESALLGIPTISYDAVPNIIESYLVRKKLVLRGKTPKEIVSLIRKLLNSSNSDIKNKSKKMLNSMEDPYHILVKTINSVLK